MSAPAYLPLFGSDYLADTSHLTTEEHGAYLLLMMAAWRQEDCGLPLDDKKLSRIAGLSARKWAQIRETILEFWHVKEGRIYQSRLLKERGYAHQKSESNRNAAKVRWEKQVAENIVGEECKRISERNAPQPQPQEELEAYASRPSGDERKADPPPEFELEAEPAGDASLKPEHVVESWNDLADRLGKPKVRDLTPERRVKLKARIAGYSVDDFRSVLAGVERSPFLRGDTGKTFCTFDWLTKKANFQKVLEGNYDG